jgi:DNA repair exonuclease SbcCD ATPase subunit
VQRALSDAEIRDRDSELAEQRARETAEREQKIADQNLMRIYGTPEDVVRARDTKLASIEGFITTSRSNLTRLETQKRSLESQLADIERAGGTIGKDRLSQVRSIENRIRSNESEVQEKEGEMEELRADFSSDLKRVRQLYQSPLDD